MEDETIQGDRNRIENKIQDIDYNNKLLELSLYENIFDDDISLLRDVKEIISYNCISSYSENDKLIKEYNSKKRKMEDLFQKKILKAIELVNQNINSVKECCLNKEENESYRNSLKNIKEFYFDKEIVSDYYKKFNQIKEIFGK